MKIVGLFLCEPGELGRLERDFFGVEREQCPGGAVLEGRDDFGHAIEHAQRHGPGQRGDGGAEDSHGVMEDGDG